ncbi:MAG: hypothetical protein AB1762_11565 [Gemmatimonadota bacterium]
MAIKLLHGESRRPWLAYVGLLGLAVVSFTLTYTAKRPLAVDSGSDVYGTDSLTALEAVQAFAAFAAEPSATGDANRQRSHTAEGLRLLGAAIYGLETRDTRPPPPSYESVGAELLQAAHALELSDRYEAHAPIVSSALLSASSALIAIQRERFPQLRGAALEVHKTAQEFSANEGIWTQSETVKRFFDRASDVLRGMAEVGI